MLDEKDRLVPKFTTSQPGKQTIEMHSLPNISRSKGSQAIRFDQLIEYNIKNIFLEKSYTKCGEQIILRKCYSQKNQD